MEKYHSNTIENMSSSFKNTHQKFLFYFIRRWVKEKTNEKKKKRNKKEQGKRCDGTGKKERELIEDNFFDNCVWSKVENSVFQITAFIQNTEENFFTLNKCKKRIGRSEKTA